MARHLALNVIPGNGAGIVVAMALLISAAPSLQAQSPMMSDMMGTNAAPTGTNAPVAAAPAAKKTSTPPAAPTPAPVPDTFNRYGKIWAPSDDAAHPIRLNLQTLSFSEFKLPSQEELNERDKIEQLAILSDDEIRTQLNEWPPFSKMKLGDEAQLLGRIQQFKDQRSRIAQTKAHELGLTLTADQQARFEKEYWEKRRQMDRELTKQFEPILKGREQKMKEELFRDFSTPDVAGVPPQQKPPAPTPPKSTSINVSQPTPATTNSGKPVPPTLPGKN